jgi:GNAT superfamily N-acetyltransferase
VLLVRAGPTRVGVRPLTANDRPAVGRALAQLSRRSCEQRFLGPVDAQGSGRLPDLTTVDGRDFFAWLAVRLPGGEVLGLAQFVRGTTDPAVAEPALLVVDRFQGLGLGTVLFRLLGGEARRRGVRRFVVTTLASNVAAVRLLAAAGGTLALDSLGVWAATVDLQGASFDPEGGDPVQPTRTGPLFSVAAPRSRPASPRRGGPGGR